jgi:hypothetical protein
MKDSIKPDISNSFALIIDAKTALILIMLLKTDLPLLRAFLKKHRVNGKHKY